MDDGKTYHSTTYTLHSHDIAAELAAMKEQVMKSKLIALLILVLGVVLGVSMVLTGVL